jgi:hypothetical protein
MSIKGMSGMSGMSSSEPTGGLALGAGVTGSFVVGGGGTEGGVGSGTWALLETAQTPSAAAMRIALIILPSF